jgi:ribonuclease P protein component
MQFTTLKSSAEFRRVRGGARCATAWFVIEGKVRPLADDNAPSRAAADRAPATGPRFGFTITRKVGSAVVRNRIRRRLKEALRLLEPGLARADHDYVVVANRAAHDYPFAELQDALRAALQRIARQAEGRGGSRRQAGGGPAMKTGRAGVHAEPQVDGALRGSRPGSRGEEPGNVVPGRNEAVPPVASETTPFETEPGAGARPEARRTTKG